MNNYTKVPFNELIGKTIANISIYNDRIVFTLDSKEIYSLHHLQDCCEDIRLEDVCGDISDLLRTPILNAFESSSSNSPKEVGLNGDESYTWTFYKICTIKGYVTIRFYGTSNGYYSEEVFLYRVKEKL